jgi:hypothetical protein
MGGGEGSSHGSAPLLELLHDNAIDQKKPFATERNGSSANKAVPCYEGNQVAGGVTVQHVGAGHSAGALNRLFFKVSQNSFLAIRNDRRLPPSGGSNSHARLIHHSFD